MFRRKNIITVSFLLLVVLIVAVVLIGRQMSVTTNEIHSATVGEVGRYQTELILQEFRKTEGLEQSARRFLQGRAYHEDDFAKILGILVPWDAKVSRAWFCVKGSADVVCVGRSGSYVPAAADATALAGMAAFAQEYASCRLYKAGGAEYWTLFGCCGEVVFGFDVALSDLHAYFAARPMVRSYFYILDKTGVVIAHPDERLLGQKIVDRDGAVRLQSVIFENKEVVFTCLSEYLSVPVERAYYPLQIAGDKWIVAVNVPQLDQQEEMGGFYRYTLLVVVFTVVVFSALLIFSQYKWRKEYGLRLKAEKQALELNMRQLKNQLNPHFLFNSLNSLSVLVGSDAGLAKEFVLKLSKVYRYLLEKRNESLATVGEEMEFAHQYYFLQKIRFGEQLIVDINENPEEAAYYIPVLSLQMLIENAIKHNEVTRQHPLVIRIYTSGGRVVVKNNYQPRTDEEIDSMGVGFESLREIYSFYSKDKFECRIEGGDFVCELPLIR